MNVGQWRSIENLSKCEKKRKIGERKKNNFFFFYLQKFAMFGVIRLEGPMFRKEIKK